jgi:hypothetical protein
LILADISAEMLGALGAFKGFVFMFDVVGMLEIEGLLDEVEDLGRGGGDGDPFLDLLVEVLLLLRSLLVPLLDLLLVLLLERLLVPLLDLPLVGLRLFLRELLVLLLDLLLVLLLDLLLVPLLLLFVPLLLLLVPLLLLLVPLLLLLLFCALRSSIFPLKQKFHLLLKPSLDRLVTRCRITGCFIVKRSDL